MVAALAGGLARAQTTDRVSVATGGAEGNGPSSVPAFSADGRYVAFVSSASNLVAGDTNGARDIFVRDLLSGTTERVSVDSAGVEANLDCDDPSISADGRIVAFYTAATNLVPNDTNVSWDVFVHDRLTGTTERASVDSAGAQATGNSRYPSLSGDGQLVAFSSNSANLVPNDTNSQYDVFVHDRLTGTTERVSVDSTGAEGNLQSIFCAISTDGLFVTFESTASNLVPGDTNGVRDILVRDLVNGTTERASIDSAGVQGNGTCFLPSISANGRFVAFQSNATNLVAGDTNAVLDVFVHDRLTGTTVRASVDSAGTQGNQQSLNAVISGTGRCVAFDSGASNLVAGDTNAFRDCFVRDLQTGTTERVSVDTAGVQGDNLSWFPWISGDGGRVAFYSQSTNLVTGDLNGVFDVFLRDRGTNPGTDICQAGVGGVSACPCSNPPLNAPRGCNNSAATGGAQLTSSGTAALSHDTLVFVTNGERASATSIVLQGNAVSSTGVVFGQGVRCVAGSLKRLYTKTASGGSITAPGPGDPSVSLRSAILNQPIAPGSSRWYAVYYRDPVVLGGCPATSTFNITQTQLVVWGS